MRVGRISVEGRVHLAAVVQEAGTELALDLTAAAAARGLEKQGFPATMGEVIRGGDSALDQLRGLIKLAKASGEAHWFAPPAERIWLVPLEPPSKFLCAGGNLWSHFQEAEGTWAREGVDVREKPAFPVGFSKLPSTLTPEGATVRAPAEVAELDYEVEVAAIIGCAAQGVREKAALEHVFGYTVFNDLTARDWQRREMGRRMLLVSKNLPGFGPLGPWILTADEARDPRQFELELTVNGERRQQGSIGEMVFGFPELIAFWSRLALEPGDLIASGTTAGVATFSDGHQGEYYLKPGDVVEAAVSGIGTLHTTIGDPY